MTKETIYTSTEGLAADTGERFFPATVLVYTPLPKRHEFYCLIGRVASESAHVEHILDATIWRLPDEPRKMRGLSMRCSRQRGGAPAARARQERLAASTYRERFGRHNVTQFELKGSRKS
jgi:hypothetical protein